MPEQNGAYYSRSLALLTKDRGWMKPLLVLGAALLLPFVGFIGVQGYALEWARLTAWGVDAAPKQKNIRVAECLASGWRGFLAGVGYALAAGVLGNLITTIFGGLGIAGILNIVVTFIGNLAYTLAALRATIYQDFAAGYAFERIWEMIRRDTDGFIKVALVTLVTSLVIGLATTMLFTVALVPMFFRFAFGIDASGVDLISGNITEPTVRYIFFEFLDAMVGMAPLLTIIAYVGSVGTAFCTLINTNVMALWVRQFDVPSWGASNDPLPMAYGLPPAGYVDPQQAAYYQQQVPQQAPYQEPVPQQAPYQQVTQQPAPQQDPYQAVPQDAYQQITANPPQETYTQPEPSQQPQAEAPAVEVQPIELAPIAIDESDKTNNVENKVVPTDTDPSTAVPEEPEPAEEPTLLEEEPTEAAEAVAEQEESVQSVQEEVSTESDAAEEPEEE